MRFALAFCPSSGQMYPPFALALLPPILRNAGHQTEIFDFNKDFFLLHERLNLPHGEIGGGTGALWERLEFLPEKTAAAYRAFFQDCVERILNSGVRAVGLSIFDSTRSFSTVFAKELKRRDPSLKIVLGGPSSFSIDRCKKFIELDFVDAVVAGEAEQSLPELLDAFEGASAPGPIPGVLFRGQREVVERSTRVDLNSLPLPDFGFWNLERYPNGELTLETSRGCIRRCSFCNDWKQWGMFRRKSAGVIIHEMSRLLEKNPTAKGFLFADSILNADIGELDLLARRLLSDGLKTAWSGFAIVRPDMKPEFLERLFQAGCWNLFFGIESGSARVLRDMNKSVPVELNSRVLRDSRKAGLTNVTFIIVGYPTETEADFQKTIDFISANAGSIGCLSVSMCNISDMHDKIDAYGILRPADNYWWEKKDGSNTFPIRIERFKRIAELALSLKVSMHIFRRGDRDSLFYFAEEMLVPYYRWKGDLVRAAEHQANAELLSRSWNEKYQVLHDSPLNKS